MCFVLLGWEGMPDKFFVSYRREDAAAEAARIRDRLTTVFGIGKVSMDVDELKPANGSIRS